MVNFVLIFFSLLSLLSCAHAPLIKDSDWFKTESGQNFDIKLQCELFNDKLESIQSWPGSFCSFRDNGELYLALKDFIRYIDSDSNIRWTKKINVHHK